MKTVGLLAILLICPSLLNAGCPKLGPECAQKILEIKEYAAQTPLDSKVVDTSNFDGDECPTLQIVNDLHARLFSERRDKRQVLKFEDYPQYVWRQDTIMYGREGFSSREKKNITAAMEHISDQTCITFKKLSKGDDPPLDGYLLFKPSESCLAFMGKSDTQPHEVFLNGECAQEVGEIIHQVVHSLGVWHQHQREDRDLYVRIVAENIRPREQGNFNVMLGLFDTFDLPYDYTSVMHFKPTQLSIPTDNGPLYTILPVDGNELYLSAMGQRVEMSFFDAKLVNLAYNCSERMCTSEFKLDCKNEGYRDPRACSKCRCPDGFSGKTCNIKGAYNKKKKCGGSVKASVERKTIESLGYRDLVSQSSYKEGVRCAWKIYADEGARVKLTFQDHFSVFCQNSTQTCYDWVEIKHKSTELALPGYRFCCYETPGVELTTTGNVALVIFKSPYQAYTNPEERRGFRLSFVAEYDDLCDIITCSNGGTCDSSTASCLCVTGYTGPTCDEHNPCLSGPCQNGGNCTTDGSTYTCHCPRGFEGENCETYDPCDVDSCENGATCARQGDVSICLCPELFEGVNCEEYHPCKSNPCENGGTCVESEDTYDCLYDPCHNSPCQNGATCEPNGPDAKCHCNLGYYGDFCQIYDPCTSDPCRNEGECEEEISGTYTCDCADGYSGINCENFDSCHSSPCQNNGDCVDNGDSTYTCECKGGHWGPTCDEDDPCQESPCENEATCDSDDGTYTCTCAPGYSGPTCDIRMDPCDEPCQNGGECLPDGDGYKCDCPSGYGGTNCQDEGVCIDHECENGATCTPDGSSYQCDCPCGHCGDRCQHACGGNDLEPGQIGLPCWRFIRELFREVVVSEKASKVVRTETCTRHWWSRRCKTVYRVRWETKKKKVPTATLR